MQDEIAFLNWGKLTQNERKVAEFRNDSYFREAWCDYLSIVPDASTALFDDIALFSFKPDAIPSGKILLGIDYLEKQGFIPVYHALFVQNRHSMRELWRYDWNVYTPDRLAMCTRLHSIAPTIVIMWKDITTMPGVPAAVRLAHLKGASDPTARTPDQLRSVMKPPNQVINFVHCADEPADVIRELGIFFDRAERKEIFNELIFPTQTFQEHKSALHATIEKLQLTYPKNNYDVMESLHRLECMQTLSNKDIGAILQKISLGQCISWDELCTAFLCEKDDPQWWDLLLVASEYLPLRRQSDIPVNILPASSIAEWKMSI